MILLQFGHLNYFANPHKYAKMYVFESNRLGPDYSKCNEIPQV